MNRRTAAIAAAITFAVGLAIGLWPLSVSGGVGCGSAFTPRTRAAQAADFIAEVADGRATNYVAQCADALGTQRVIALIVVGISVVVLVIALFRRSDAATASRSPRALR